MEHIVQFAIGIDDEAIKKRIEESATKQVTDKLKEQITGTILRKSDYSWGNNGSMTLTRNGEDIVKDVMEQYKDEIIAGAIKVVADSIKNSKKYRAVLAQIADDMLTAKDGDSNE